MKCKLKLFIVLVFLASFFNAHSQNNERANKITNKLHYYSFSGILSFDAEEQMKTEILNMQFVTEAKIEYKTEKGLGQLRIFTSETYINSDTDFEFNIYNVKQLLLRNNLIPNEYKSETIYK